MNAAFGLKDLTISANMSVIRKLADSMKRVIRKFSTRTATVVISECY